MKLYPHIYWVETDRGIGWKSYMVGRDGEVAQYGQEFQPNKRWNKRLRAMATEDAKLQYETISK